VPPTPAPASAASASSTVAPSSGPNLAISPAATGNRQVESEIVVEGLVSYGNYRIFASTENCKLYDIAIEYDRHSWGRFLGARADYVAEILPVLLLNQPAETDIWGDTLSASRKTVAGIGIAPIGFRLLWRDRRSFKPYLIAKGGIVGFTQKVLSQKATYESFSLKSEFGVQVRLSERADLRLGLFNDFHISNGFITPVDPGLDVMNATFGVSYRLGRAAPRR